MPHAEVLRRLTPPSVCCITDKREGEYRELDENFEIWYDSNHLKINSGKTKELVVDFRCRRTPRTPVEINGEGVEMVDS